MRKQNRRAQQQPSKLAQLAPGSAKAPTMTEREIKCGKFGSIICGTDAEGDYTTFRGPMAGLFEPALAAGSITKDELERLVERLKTHPNPEALLRTSGKTLVLTAVNEMFS